MFSLCGWRSRVGRCGCVVVRYEAWKASKFSNPWCFENFIQARAIKRAQDVRKQLLSIMDR